MPAGQASDPQETDQSRYEHLPAVQTDEAAARGVPELRDLQRPGSHCEGLRFFNSRLR